MSPCNIFFSSKAMMEMVGKRQFMINNEQNINVDKTFLKLSVKDIGLVSEVLEFVMQDLKKFNDEILEIARNKTGSVLVADINKNLDFGRSTKIIKDFGSLNKSNEASFDIEKGQRLLTSHRKISDIPNDFNNTLRNTVMHKERKSTEEDALNNMTGGQANPDEDSYQSKIIVKQLSQVELVRNEECEPGYDSNDIFLAGLRIILMNEQEKTFYPVMDISVSEVHFVKYITLKSSRGETSTSIS